MKFNRLFLIALSLGATIVETPAHASSLTTKCSGWNLSRNQPPHESALQSEAKGALTPIPLESVRMLDAKTAKTVFVQSLQARRTDADTVEVVARVFNCSDEPKTVVARTHFMDSTKYATEPVSAWSRLILPAHALSVYSERSVGTESAETFLIEMELE